MFHSVRTFHLLARSSEMEVNSWSRNDACGQQCCRLSRVQQMISNSQSHIAVCVFVSRPRGNSFATQPTYVSLAICGKSNLAAIRCSMWYSIHMFPSVRTFHILADSSEMGVNSWSRTDACEQQCCRLYTRVQQMISNSQSLISACVFVSRLQGNSFATLEDLKIDRLLGS